MREGIHPTYYTDAKVTCASCGKTWTTGSTKKELRVDICSNCHPFFTGEASRISISKVRSTASIRSYRSARPTWNSRRPRKNSRVPRTPHRGPGPAARALDALKKAGIENVGQFMDKLNAGNDAVLAIAGFGQASLTAAKKKLRSLGYELPEAAA